MSYYRTFSPSEEAIDEIRKHVRRANSYDINHTEIELCTYCMADHDIADVNQVIDHIHFLLRSIAYDMNSVSYQYAVDRYEEDDDKTVWFCGWKYAKDEPDTTTNEAIEYALSKLVNLSCVVKTPDWFDDNEKYYDKQREIEDVIEYVKDIAVENGDFEIIGMLKEFELKEDQDLNEDDRETNLSDVDNTLTVDKNSYVISSPCHISGFECSSTSIDKDKDFIVYTQGNTSQDSYCSTSTMYPSETETENPSK